MSQTWCDTGISPKSRAPTLLYGYVFSHKTLVLLSAQSVSAFVGYLRYVAETCCIAEGTLEKASVQ